MGWLRDAQLRTITRFSGRLNNDNTLSELLGHALLAQAALPFGANAKRLHTLLNACRRTSRPWSRRLLRLLLQSYLVGESKELSRRAKVGWERYHDFGAIDTERALTTSLVLKAPKPGGEKGVLYCSFEFNWMRLVAHYDAAAVLDAYYLVGASSWSPTDYAAIAPFAGLSTDPIFIGISNPADYEQLALMRPVAEPLAIMASDWIDPAAYAPKPHRARGIDILMVANWTRHKRHWLLFEALRDMPSHLRVVLVGRNGPDRTEKEILEEARIFGVKQQLELHTNLETDEVAALQCDARTSIICSRREGSCVATAESLFAGSPVAMMKDAHVGSKAYINARTGVLLERRGMAKSLQRFWAESERYTPRQWALQHIPCTRASERLNAVLRERAVATARPWTEDIAPMCWRYVPAYFDPADEVRLAPAVEELRRKYGVEIEKFAGERETRRRHELGAPGTTIEFPPELAVPASEQPAPEPDRVAATAETPPETPLRQGTGG